jgi:hypothetical protein
LLLNGWTVCAAGFFEDVIMPRGLPKITGDRIALVDEPNDGLPADYSELVGEVRRRG